MSKLINIMKNFKKNPSDIFLPLARYGFFDFLSDENYLKFIHKIEVGRKLNLDEPKLFSEKIQYLKLNDKQDWYSDMVDKYKVREIIRKKFGEEYLIPLIGIYDNARDIEWDVLPNKFVAKCNNGSGLNYICNDKTRIEKKKIEKLLNSWLNKKPFRHGREWQYRGVESKIIIERLMEENSSDNISVDLVDYKFFCFNGSPRFCQIISDRSKNCYMDFYSIPNWIKQEFNGIHGSKIYPISNKNFSKPEKLNEMINMVKELSRNTKFVRVDLYYISGKIYFGEFTLYPKSGFGKFKPYEWNYKLGDMIKISNNGGE